MRPKRTTGDLPMKVLVQVLPVIYSVSLMSCVITMTAFPCSGSHCSSSAHHAHYREAGPEQWYAIASAHGQGLTKKGWRRSATIKWKKKEPVFYGKKASYAQCFNKLNVIQLEFRSAIKHLHPLHICRNLVQDGRTYCTGCRHGREWAEQGWPRLNHICSISHP